MKRTPCQLISMGVDAVLYRWRGEWIPLNTSKHHTVCTKAEILAWPSLSQLFSIHVIKSNHAFSMYTFFSTSIQWDCVTSFQLKNAYIFAYDYNIAKRVSTGLSDSQSETLSDISYITSHFNFSIIKFAFDQFTDNTGSVRKVSTLFL